MHRAWLLVILLGPLGAAALSGAAVEDLAGLGAGVSAQTGILRARTPAGPWALSMNGSLEVQVVDDRFDVLQAPIPPPLGPVNYHDRSEEAWQSHSTAYAELTSVDPDAVLLVLPVQGQARIETAGAWVLGADEARLLEESHAFTQNTTAPHYYAYRTPAAANWTTTAPSTWTASGAFEVYAWGLTLTISDAQGDRTLKTGAWTTEDGRFRHREHNAFAVLRVNGDLHGKLAAPQDVHAQALHLEPEGPVEVVARGVVQTDDATYALDGPTTLHGGAYTVRLAPYGLVIDAQDASRVSGAGVSRLDYDEDRALVLLAGALGIALFLFIAFGLAVRWGWLGDCTTWLDRADAALDQQSLAWAGFCARLACLIDPASGEAVFLRAKIHAEAQHRGRALRDYRTAYLHLSDARDQAVAAFEASRLEALAGRAAQAADWLLKAIDHDAGLLQRAQRERDFAAVLQEPAFKDPIAGHFGLGANR